MSDESVPVDWSVVDAAPAMLANVVALQATDGMIIVSLGQFILPLDTPDNMTADQIKEHTRTHPAKIQYPVRVALPRHSARLLMTQLHGYFQSFESRRDR